MTHRPPTPFGCSRTWGRPIMHPDGRVHICANTDPKHQGLHVCACGEKAASRATVSQENPGGKSWDE